MSRPERVCEQMRREVSQILQEEIKDPRIGFITVIRVEITKDLRFARIFYSILGKDKDQKEAKEALESAHGFIRRLIGQRLKLRLTPEIVFIYDKSSEYSIEIQEALDRLKKGDDK